MTREEAIAVLRREIEPSVYEDEKSIAEAIDMAIEALSLANLKEEFESAEYEDYEHASLVDIKEPLKVLVVRCKDCIHWQKTNIETIDGEPTYDCPFCGEWADANGFCSFGERKEK